MKTQLGNLCDMCCFEILDIYSKSFSIKKKKKKAASFYVLQANDGIV